MAQLNLFDDLFSKAAPAEQLKKHQAVPPEKNELSEQVKPVNEKPVIVKKNPEELLSNNFIEGAISGAHDDEVKDLQQFVYNDGVIGVKIKAKPFANSEAFISPKSSVKKVKSIRIPQKAGRKSIKEMNAEADLIDLPDDESLFAKQYYPISEVAKWFNVNTSLIRFWSNEFDILKPRKNRKGDRLFTPQDVKNLQLIYQLLRVRKFTIEGAKDYIKANKQKADMQLQLTQTLQKFKGFLLELKTNLQS